MRSPLSHWRIAAFILMFTPLVLTVRAAGNLIDVREGGEEATLTIHFSSPPEYKVRHTRKGMVINFNRPLELPDLAPTEKRLRRWLSSLWAGYDALLLRPQSGIDADLELQGNDLVIHLRPAARPEAGNGEGRYALERVKGLLLLKSGRVREARQRFADLARRYPDRLQAYLDLAAAEERLGRWRQALAAYRRAARLAPDATEVQEARRRLLQAHGTGLRLGAAYVSVGSDETHRIAQVDARHLAANGRQLALEYELRDSTIDTDVRRLDGSRAPFTGSRHQLALHLEQELGPGVQRASLFAGARKLGLGWRYELPGDDMRAGLTLEWNRPWYESPEALVGYGDRDRVLVHYQSRPWDALELSGDASYNRYGLDGLDDAARSLRLQFDGRYYYSLVAPTLSFGYDLDWEDVSHRAERLDAGGATFQPLPLEDREQHTLDVAWRRHMSDRLTLGAQAGFEYDRRRNARAPFGRLQLDFDSGGNLTAGANVETGLSSYRGGEDSFYRIGGYLNWAF